MLIQFGAVMSSGDGWGEEENQDTSQSTARVSERSPAPEEKITTEEISLMKKALRSRLLDVNNHQVRVVRSDPKSPLFSIKNFEELNLPSDLLKGLYGMGFSAPSKIQETTLPILLLNPPQNLIAQSQSGTGKTAAFLLASLYRIKPEEHHPQVLILSPTYELTLQTLHVAKQMSQFMEPKITFFAAVRGTVGHRGMEITEHVIIGTPGKLMDLGLRYMAFDLTRVRVFVLDEADVMIDTQGHRNQSMKIQRSLNLKKCQMLLFSATYDDPVMEFAQMIIPEPLVSVFLKREEETLVNIKQYYVECPSEAYKYTALANLFGTISMGQAFIFVETKRSAASLAEKLMKDGHQVGLISGDLTVEERTHALQLFRDGINRVMIATNVMSRGIDVDAVTVVINYDLPVNYESHDDVVFETYLHRIGRTGRFGKFGLAINFVDSYRGSNLIRKIESHFGKKILKLNAGDMDEIEKINQD